MKEVMLNSFGYRLFEPDEIYEDNTLRLIWDVREAIEDPYKSGLKESGLDEEVRNFILDQESARDLILMLKGDITKLLIKLTILNYSKLYVYIGCSGGLQRSVVIVENLFYWLTKNVAEKIFTIKKNHLTLKEAEEYLKNNSI